MPNAAIIITGDFNRLNIKQIVDQFRLKQLEKFPTGGNLTLDLTLTNLDKFYQNPKNPRLLGYLTILQLPFSKIDDKNQQIQKKNDIST